MLNGALFIFYCVFGVKFINLKAYVDVVNRDYSFIKLMNFNKNFKYIHTGHHIQSTISHFT